MARSVGSDPRDALTSLLSSLDDGELDEAIRAIEARKQKIMWQRLPDRIVLMRHGQSEGNVDPLLYTCKGDSRLELTSLGVQQSKDAGARLASLVSRDDRILVCVSPFERTYQTLLGLYHGGFPQEQVTRIHVDAQIREQEFGNFQSPGLSSKVRVEQEKVGRFYYRRPDAESSADVLDRVTLFWHQLLSNDKSNGLLHGADEEYSLCLVVTQGLTIRLMLMCLLHWSVETFESAWNLGNCEYHVLKKNMADCSYELYPPESYPARMPWGTRELWIVRKSLDEPDVLKERLKQLQDLKLSFQADDGVLVNRERLLELDKLIDETKSDIMMSRSEPYTVIDYISIPQPRTSNIEEVLPRLIPGHNVAEGMPPEELMRRAQEADPIDMDDVDFVDWWGPGLSHCGKMLRGNVYGSVHFSPKGSPLA
eukprot:TRINITY_DN49247_c0_g1_i1.p1 TRINITY_DN49247_c0_g1~~TRINITY_DN49247_c0_g1_i1.p1  ORF type:complete len:424 (+),score=39.77 TRINITY_DN49247_c0_g1_i1:76-1347(+)